MIDLFLDDLRPCPKGFHIARTVEEAVSICESNNIRRLSLDHDLGGVEGNYTLTGYDFCKWLVEKWVLGDYSALPEAIFLHTSNPVGRDNMRQILHRYNPGEVKVYNSPMPEYNLATGGFVEGF
ncbi:cyclic-phosphate processing receiver domain-containing protein [Paenibacillus chitinolyticus]|uniref:Cyclic-phosphate processing Receiver domain-containing protein n=1 Tax=Paenibacillus chitinolyticus TaxID=79263 RepID=A0ABT4FMP7_9BACL|nr:cyclic-phosphate processing receiver domain-containing protein [Paenibacillus chitinolyticus]MCY9592321.1 hypothetical protein [Paenibacillus chitinolyticus]MCY9599783.1 hypothetical protein [Paenibacillus chitinolyticus]